MIKVKAVRKFLVAGSLAFVLFLQGCSPTTSDPSVTQGSESIPSGPFTPQLSSTFDEPWPTEVTRREMIETALYKGFEFFDSVSRQECGYEALTFIDDTHTAENEQVIKTVSDEMMLIFCDYLTHDFAVLAGRYAFVKEVAKNEGLPTDEFGGVCGYFIEPEDDAVKACAFRGKVAWIGTALGKDLAATDEGVQIAIGVVAHEVFHLVHSAMDPDPDGQAPPPGAPFYRPVWFVEGGGEYFGGLIPVYLGIHDYLTWTPSSLTYEPLSVDALSELSELELRLEGDENYFSGQIALEYITASVGMEALLDVWVRMGEGASFEDAFEGALGISVQDFYVNFSQMHRNLYEGEIVE